jgi:ABC-type Mn2+/Zn2+ transport system ATPase subunit
LSGLLEIENIALSYGDRSVLRSVTLEVAPGEFLALVGVNGAGKSTLLDIIAGFRKPTIGSVVIAGRDQRAWSLRELSQRVSHLPQAVHSDLPYMAEQLVAMGRLTRGARQRVTSEAESMLSLHRPPWAAVHLHAFRGGVRAGTRLLRNSQPPAPNLRTDHFREAGLSILIYPSVP